MEQFYIAANVKNKSGIGDSNIKKIPPVKQNTVVIRPKLEVRVLSGEFEKWGNAITIQKPDILTFRWGYFGTAAKSALWYLSDKPFDSSEKPNLLKRGQIKYIPEHGKFGLFKINLSNYLPPNPFNSPRNYYVRVVPLNEKFAPIESPSLPVIITYKKPANITEFHPYEFDKKMQIKRFKPLHKIRIHAIRTADTNGDNSANISPEEIKNMINHANLVWWLSGIEFSFDPNTDFQHINSTHLNRRYSEDDETALHNIGKAYDPLLKYSTTSYKVYENAKNYFADKYKDKLIIFFSYGDTYKWDIDNQKPLLIQGIYEPSIITNKEQTIINNRKHLRISGFIDDHRNDALKRRALRFAHMLGHHFGLYHTYYTGDLIHVADCSKKLEEVIKNGEVLPQNALSYYDNDKNTVTDTPPDLGSSIFWRSNKDQCDLSSTVKIPVYNLGKSTVFYELNPDKLNLMSNFNCKNFGLHHLSIEQIKRARNSIENGNRKYLIQ